MKERTGFPKDWHLRTPALRKLGQAILGREKVRDDPYNCAVRKTQEEARRAKMDPKVRELLEKFERAGLK